MTLNAEYIGRAKKPMALEGEKRLRGWQAIARSVGCSVRTAQRLEKERGLPVHRNAALGIHAYVTEIEAWLKNLKQGEIAALGRSTSEAMNAPDPTQSESSVPPLMSAGGTAAGNGAPPRNRAALSAWLRRGVLLGAGTAVFLGLIVALLSSAYGLAITAFVLGAIVTVLAYIRSTDTLPARALVAVYMIVSMAYVCSASTMPEFQASIINAATLSPAPAFLIVIGLKFIPLFIVVLFYWVVFGGPAAAGLVSNPSWERRYMLLGILFLAVELLSLAEASGDDRIWKAGVPGRWTLLISSAVVLMANLAVWLAGRHYFRSGSAPSYRPLFGLCATAYLIVAMAAYFVDHEHNQFNKYYLDIRWPEAYVARNPQAIADLVPLLGPKIRRKIGPDLASIFKDEEFKQQLRRGIFYKQHSDEPFQVFHPAVMFAYKRPGSGRSRPAPFVAIRFPKELAEALRFEPITQEK